jgi:hypothetical protein
MPRLEQLDTDEPLPDPWEGAAATVRSELEQRTGQREQVKIRRLTFRKWADRVPEPRGPLDFNRFVWQRELYEAADDREAVYQKATQVGVSTQAIRWALYHSDVHQRVVLYTFPTDKELGDFSRQRIKPVIRASQHLRSRMSSDAVDNVGQKQIGSDGWIYFRGTNKPIDSVNADVVVFDEYDTSDQINIEASERRVTGPDSAGLIRRVGVPSIPGFGISALYDGSDQRVWTVRCGKGHWNPMRGYEAFSQNVDQARVVLVCKDCGGQLDVRKGEWVATHPDREVRGYHIPKLIVPGAPLSILITNSKKTRPDQVEAFHTRDLGEPYAPAEGRLSLEQVQACVRPELRLQESLISYNLTTMGVDMASARALNVVIEDAVGPEPGAPGRKVWVGTVEDTMERTAFQQLCWLMEAYNVNMCGIDNEPDGRFSQAFAARYPGRVYRMDFFTPAPAGRTEPHVWNVDDDARFCSLWRTKVYDATFERFRMQQVLLPPLEQLPADYAKHLGNLYRRRVELPGDTGKARVEYVRTGPEDYAQCEAYNLAAIELYWRNAGIAAAVGQGPVPMVDQIDDYVESDLSSFGEDATAGVYRPGFD